jgi:hypothetical protein
VPQKLWRRGNSRAETARWWMMKKKPALGLGPGNQTCIKMLERPVHPAVCLARHGRHSRSKNGVAELVIGPATSGRTPWLAYIRAIPFMRGTVLDDRDVRVKPAHDEGQATRS